MNQRNTLENPTVAANPPGPVGLDVGYDAVRCVHLDGDRLCLRRQSAMYAVVPDSAGRRRLLSAAGVSYSHADDSLLVIGDTAAEVSESFGVPLVPAFPDAGLPADDPVGRQVIATLVESTLGRGGGVCGLSVPGRTDADTGVVRFVGNLVTLAGYQPLIAHSAAAAGVVLHEASGLTGVTVDFGAARVDISLLSRGREVWHADLARGAASVVDDIARAGNLMFHDREGHRYRDLVAAREWIADPDRPGDHTSSRARKLSADVDALLSDTCTLLRDVIDECRAGRVATPLAVALTGGFANLPGLTGRFSDHLRRLDEAGHLTPLANDPRDGLTVARGLLMLAELETPRVRAAA